jgi:hypothetical protein
VALLESRLFVELVKAEDGWWWHNAMIGNRPELGHGCFGMPVVGIMRGRMWCIAGGVESIALCS